ncbi:NADAR family protein [Flammeovirga kamogawensis]|uniref:NADAR family protein n=1 Tax=Flammeovirga kamogawensis TaxID=373891 RepID=A0ABX8H3K5_9BACT|nr:NADAR family protein [Flammeovirga kamogawensis]MBB6464108.1 hypothetical protein [Flammeovirga kamogawensis]QWG09907.1 NADAR family protein [Flammeovirga kamogawensis]TRX65411.1 NADAR family protein [Flammeovirga kamogawensis]
MEAKYSLEWLKIKEESNTSIKFLFFWGHTKNHKEEVGNFCFSQWYESSFTIKGITYLITEHWMMAEKARLFGDEIVYQQIINCQKPGEAKDLGRQVKNFDEEVWKKYRYEIVKIGNIYKFTEHKKMGEYLLNTQSRVLVEASPVDIIWGIGLTKDSDSSRNVHLWRGLNLLGFALMETRDFLKDNGFEIPSSLDLTSSLNY